MKETHFQVRIGSVIRDLPIISVSGARVALFDLTEDPELIEAAAAKLAALLPDEIQVLVTVEGKAQGLVQLIAIKLGLELVVFRKKPTYLDQDSLVQVTYTSITKGTEQRLYTHGKHAEKLRGRKSVFVDDVISSGETLEAALKLIRFLDAPRPAAIATVFTEGDELPGVIKLGHLPVWPKK